MVGTQRREYFLFTRDLVKEIAFELDFKEWERFQLWEDNGLVMKIIIMREVNMYKTLTGD